MKKILLSCVTCLLALGLVTACNNEDEEENNESTTQDTGTGGGSDTGSGGGSSEPVTLTNYIVSFSFVDEDGAPTTLGDGYTLYLQGSWAADEGGYWDDEWIECPYDEETGYYVAIFESIETGTYKYKGVSCETGSPSWNGEEVVTDNGGDATLTVTETNSGQIIETVYVPPVYLSGYTLSFTIMSTDSSTLPDYVALYISGDFNKWALDELELDETNSAYTYAIESISVGKHEYKVIACYADEGGSWDDCIEVVAGEDGANAEFVVEESQGENSKYEASIDITGIDFTTLQPETLSNVTLRFTFYATDGVTPLGTVPEGYKVSVAGDFTESGWDNPTALTADSTETGQYSITLSTVTSGTYEFEFLYNKSDETGDDLWKHPLTSDNLHLKIGKGTSDSTIEYDVVTSYDDFADIIHEIDENVTSDFYIVLLDASETSTEDFASVTIALGTGGNYFTGSPSVGTTTGGTTYLASPEGNAPTWTNDWFTFYVGSWTDQIQTGYIDIPTTTEDTVAVYVASAHLNILLGTNTESSETAWDGYWATDVSDFDVFIATL